MRDALFGYSRAHGHRHRPPLPAAPQSRAGTSASPFSNVTCLRRRPAAAGARGGRPPPPPPQGSSAPPGDSAEVALGNLGSVGDLCGDRGAALPACGEEEAEAAPVSPRGERKGRGGERCPRCAARCPLPRPGEGQDRPREPLQGQLPSLDFSRRSGAFPPGTFRSDACSRPGEIDPLPAPRPRRPHLRVLAFRQLVYNCALKALNALGEGKGEKKKKGSSRCLLNERHMQRCCSYNPLLSQ